VLTTTEDASTTVDTTSTDTAPSGVTLPTGTTRIRFGTLGPPKVPIKASGGTTPDNLNSFEHQNKFAHLRQHGSESGDRGSETLSSGILRGVSVSVASSSRGSRGREPTPLTPEIPLLLDRLEPDKGKQAQLLTEHLT
jgi:hypothetical protein